MYFLSLINGISTVMKVGKSHFKLNISPNLVQDKSRQVRKIINLLHGELITSMIVKD